MDSQLGGTDLDYISRFDTPRANLSATVDENRCTADRRNLQPAECAGREEGVLGLDTLASQLQVLVRCAPDGQLAGVDEEPARLPGALWRTAGGGPAQ
jgi:hypothetical protein